ncbi:MAG: sulfurtransferase [Gammaproteobacteria bacterium]|jgi:thiosulfate/3-mercaptopyruvate sulfurtransferase
MQYTTLIDTRSLHENLGADDLVVLDCRFDLMRPDAGRREWEASHIPGSRYVHLDQDLSAPVISTVGRHPLPNPHTFAKTLESWGIGNESQVVAYDASCGAYAVRLWWMMRWLGHQRVAVLDGGWQKWIAGEYPVNNALPVVEPEQFEHHADDNLWFSTPEIKSKLADGFIILVDARTSERFEGESEPIDPVAGHVPGAVNFPYQKNLDDDGCFLPAETLRKLYSDFLGEIDYRHVVHMCGSGVTACHNLLAMEHAGLSGSRLYPGSWSEWIRTEKPAG